MKVTHAPTHALGKVCIYTQTGLFPVLWDSIRCYGILSCATAIVHRCEILPQCCPTSNKGRKHVAHAQRRKKNKNVLLSADPTPYYATALTYVELLVCFKRPYFIRLFPTGCSLRITFCSINPVRSCYISIKGLF